MYILVYNKEDSSEGTGKNIHTREELIKVLSKIVGYDTVSLYFEGYIVYLWTNEINTIWRSMINARAIQETNNNDYNLYKHIDRIDERNNEIWNETVNICEEARNLAIAERNELVARQHKYTIEEYHEYLRLKEKFDKS